MKKSNFVLLLAVALCSVFTFGTAMASTEVSAKETRQALLKKTIDGQADVLIEKMTETKMSKKAEKMLKKFDKKFGGGDKVDFQSEPDRWMWFWLAGWALGFVFYMMGWLFIWPFVYIGHLLWLGGTICLFVWLLKKFELL